MVERYFKYPANLPSSMGVFHVFEIVQVAPNRENASHMYICNVVDLQK